LRPTNPDKRHRETSSTDPVVLLDPDTISKLSDNATIHEVAIEAGKRLHAALDAL